MRSYLFLSLLPVLVVGAAAPPSVKPEDLGQVTLTMHATISCRTHYVTMSALGQMQPARVGLNAATLRG
jgi:hypothetical protein